VAKFTLKHISVRGVSRGVNLECPVSIWFQLPAKNSSYSRLEVESLLLNILAFGCSDHNLEFHLPVNWDAMWRAKHWHGLGLGQLLSMFSGFNGDCQKKKQREVSSRGQAILPGILRKCQRAYFCTVKGNMLFSLLS